MDNTTLDHSVYPQKPAPSGSYPQFLRRNPAVGWLKIQASRAHRALPTEGVEITVLQQFNDQRVLFFHGTTDADGLISDIPLPAPPRAASLQSRTPRQGAIYQVFASHPDFAPMRYEAEIFEGITSILPVVLRLPREAQS